MCHFYIRVDKDIFGNDFFLQIIANMIIIKSTMNFFPNGSLYISVFLKIFNDKI